MKLIKMRWKVSEIVEAKERPKKSVQIYYKRPPPQYKNKNSDVLTKHGHKRDNTIFFFHLL